EVAADRVAELPETYGEGVAVAGNADVVQAAVGGVRAHGDRGHAAVHGIEAVAAAHEVGGGLGGAADARQLHHVLRLERQAPARLDDRRGDRVMPAARAQRSEEHTSELQSRGHLVCRLLLEKKNFQYKRPAQWPVIWISTIKG